MDVDSNGYNVLMQQDSDDISLILGTPEHVKSGINVKNIV